MKKNNNIVKCCVLFLITVLFLGLNFDVGSVFAAEEEVPEYRLTIAPSQKNLKEIKPGESYSDSFMVKNTGKQDFDYEVSISPYSVETESYEPNYDKETQYTDIVKWIEIDKETGSVKAGEEDELKYIVTVPQDAHGGAQAATIMVTMTGTGNSEEGVTAVRRLGYIVYGNVDGEVIETGKILENKVPSFLFNPPIKASSLVENTGNVYTVATYKLQVFPLFSDEEVYTNEEKPENNIIFPETKRYNELKWEGAPQLGIFKVRSTVKIFDEESVTEKIVFLCPIWFLFIVLLIIFCAIFWIVSRVVRRKKEA